MFEWQEFYLTSERSERANVLCSFYFINVLMTPFLTIFEDFQPLSEDFRRFSKIVPKARRTFPNIFQKFPKITEDYLRLPRIEKTTEEEKWRLNCSRCTNRDGTSRCLDSCLESGL